MLEPLPVSFVATRDAMHALAEHVLAAVRYRADRHIGLVATTGGFGTPAFGDGERVRVEGVELVHERPGTVTRIGLTTLGTAAQFVGVPLGAPADIYKPTTPCAPDLSIAPDPDAAHALAAWIALGDSLLAELRDTYAAHAPTSSTIWPEHFDLACELGDGTAGTRAGYGASPGDASIPEPYLYVQPWEPSRRTGKLGTQSFGAALTYGDLAPASDARGAGLDFLLEGAALLLGQP
jgi:hypothetical protein